MATLVERLRDRRRIDLGLTSDVNALETLQPLDGLREAIRILVQKAADLQAAIADVSAGIQNLREFEGIVRFTEVGWSERRDEIVRMCQEDPTFGLANWLEDWYTALAAYRLDACDRLLSMQSSLPPGTGVLVRRCRATQAALQVDDWEVAAALVEVGANGVAVGPETVPPPAVRLDLWVLLIRFALAVNQPGKARQSLEAAKRTATVPILSALSERLRLSESGESASADMMRIGAGSTDALLEMARVLNDTASVGSADLAVDSGMTAARTAIAAARSLDEAERQVCRMLQPIPAEIHLAFAERARADQDVSLARASLQRAKESAVNVAVRAEAHDQLGELAALDGDIALESSERLAAAHAWLSASRFDRALVSAERVTAINPDDVEARYYVANSLVALSSNSSEKKALRWLARALDEIERLQSIVDSSDDESTDSNRLKALGYWVESYAHAKLGDYSRSDHKWLALVAALRAVALQLDDSAMWLSVADAAYDLDLWALAELASREAARLSPDRDTVAQHTRALTNLGEYEAALEALADPTSVLEWNMKAFILLRLGRIRPSIAVFSEHPPDPEYEWARSSNAIALLLAGQTAESLAMLKDLDVRLRHRPIESWRGAIARVSLLIGDYQRVEDTALDQRARGKHDCDFELALVCARQGRWDEATDLLKSYVRNFSTLQSVHSWQHIELDLIRITLGAEAPLLDLSAADRELEAVRGSLMIRRDPLVEFNLAKEAADGEMAAVSAADPLITVIVAVAQDNVLNVDAGLQMLDANERTLAASLHRWVQRRFRTQEAEAAVAAAVAGRTAEASHQVSELLKKDPVGAGALLQTSPDGITPEVLSVLRALTQDPDVGPDAELVIRQLEPSQPMPALGSEPFRISISLPQSWFERVTNPTKEHPFFLRYLPAMRYGSPSSIPPVSVSSDSEIEPNGYRILVLGAPVEQGWLPVDRRLISDAALRLLPKAWSETAQPENQPALRQLGTWTIPDSPQDQTSLAELLSNSTLEVAAQRLEAAAASQADEIVPSDG